MLYINLIIFTAIMFVTAIIFYIEWKKISKIYHNNYTFFDVLFIVIYPIEEALFLFLYYLDTPLKQSLWVSLIVVVICTTLVIDKWLLKKQNNNAINTNLVLIDKLILENQKLGKKYKSKIKLLEEDKKDLIDYIDKIHRLKKHTS